MSPTMHEQLIEYALGTLPEDEAVSLRVAIATDTALLAELRAIEDDLAFVVPELAGADPAAAQVPAGFKGRLLSSIAHHGRLERFADQVAGMVDGTLERARHLLRLVDDDGAWVPLFPGCDALHIRPGPRVAGLDVGLVRVAPGRVFPTHTHLGDEHVMVLQGQLLDEDGSSYGPGEVVTMKAGTSHSFRAAGADGLVYLVVTGGVEIPGVTLQEPPAEMLH